MEDVAHIQCQYHDLHRHRGLGILDSPSLSCNSRADDRDIAAAEEACLSMATDDGCAEDRDDGSVFLTQQEPHPCGAAQPPRVDRLVGDVLLSIKGVLLLVLLHEALAEARHDGGTVTQLTDFPAGCCQGLCQQTQTSSVHNQCECHPADQSLRLPATLGTVVQQLEARLGRETSRVRHEKVLDHNSHASGCWVHLKGAQAGRPEHVHS